MPVGATLAEKLAAIEQAVEAERQRLDVPGASLALVQEDRVVLVQGFGLRDREAALPVTARTTFAIGSISKTFTALAAEISADEGKLSLDDPPRRFLPYFQLRDPELDAQVTLRDLLGHRTGLAPVDDFYGWFERYGGGEALIRVAMQAESAGPFRESFHYNNALVLAAGEAVAAAQGVAWRELIESRILVPLGMHATGLSCADLERAPELAVGYEGESPRRPLPRTSLAYLDAIPPAGGISSNAEDMALLLRMLVGGGVSDGRRLVSERGLQEMQTKSVDTPAKACGLGLFIEPWHGHRRYFHQGGVPGFGSCLEFLPDQHLGFVVLTNVDDQQLANAIREIVYAQLVP